MTPKMLSDAVMRLVDLLAMNPAETREIDPRSWDRLRIYMPNDPYAEAIETIGERMREALQRCLDHFEKISGHKDPSAMMIQAQDALRAWQRKPKTVLEISTAPPSANTEALLRKLSDAADEVLAPLGCHGTISARDDRVMALMDVMYEADKVLGKNGERPKPVPEKGPLDRLAETSRELEAAGFTGDRSETSQGQSICTCGMGPITECRICDAEGNVR